MSPAVIVSAVLGLLAIIAMIASAVAVLRANLSKTTIETYKASNDALKERVELLAGESERTVAKMATLEAENKLLRTLNSGADAVKAMGDAVADQVRQAREEHHDIMAALQVFAEIFAASQKEKS